jgi:hypothetical protein
MSFFSLSLLPISGIIFSAVCVCSSTPAKCRRLKNAAALRRRLQLHMFMSSTTLPFAQVDVFTRVAFKVGAFYA